MEIENEKDFHGGILHRGKPEKRCAKMEYHTNEKIVYAILSFLCTCD